MPDGLSDGLNLLLAAVVAFVACHLILSHTLRAQAVAVLGRGGFQAVYSAVSVMLLLAVLVAYHRAAHVPMLWQSDNPALQLVYGVGSCLAAALFAASLFDNPALVGAKIADLSTRPPSGVYLITRHPMMFAIAIWSALQIMISPTARNLIAYGGLALLALVGSRLQDRKKVAQSGREWATWVSRTPYWPRLRRLGHLGPAWLIGAILAVLVTAVQTRTTLTPVGLWYFLPQVF